MSALETPDAGELMERVSDVTETLIRVGGLSAAGVTEDHSEQILRALYDLQLVTQYLQAIGDDDDEIEEAGERDLAVLRVASAERGRAAKVEG
jgi:hypothetical protein